MVLCLIVRCGNKTGKIRPTTEKQMKDPEAAEDRSRRAAERWKRRFELLENEIKDKILKIDEPGKTIVEIPFSEEDGLGETRRQSQ